MQSDQMEQVSRNSPLDLATIYHVLFRHKRKIALSLGLGVIGVLVTFAVMKLQYKSEAKILVRYVVDTKLVAPAVGADTLVKSPDRGGENIINSEAETLRSWDVVNKAVAASATADKDFERLTQKDPGVVQYFWKNMDVRTASKSDVIRVSLAHPNGKIATLVLNNIVQQFQKKHHEMHGVGIKDEVLTAQMLR